MTAKLIANASITLIKKAAKGDPMTRNGVTMQEQKSQCKFEGSSF